MCRDIECEDHASPFDLCRQYIRGESLLSRLVHHRDENPIAVDYDVDTDDDDFLENINDGGADELWVNEMEKAMHALEVESFDLLLHHVEVIFSLSPSLCPSLPRSHPPLPAQRKI